MTIDLSKLLQALQTAQANNDGAALEKAHADMEFHDVKVAKTIGKYTVLRYRSYGFRCSTKDSQWIVFDGIERVNGYGHNYRLKDAQALVDQLIAKSA